MSAAKFWALNCGEGSFERLSKRDLIALWIEHVELAQTPGMAYRCAHDPRTPGKQFLVEQIGVMYVDVA
jgi:hypothetical protein